MVVVALLAAGLVWAPGVALGVAATTVVVAPLLFLYYRSAGEERERAGEVAELEGRVRELGELVAAARGEAERLERALSAMPDPVLVADGAGRIMAANAALAALAGVRARDRLLEEVFPASDLGRFHAAAIAGEPVSDQIVLRGPAGARMWEVQARRVTGEHGGAPSAVMTFRDVTEPARAVQVRTDFVANASHELRTPIAAIRMALDTLGAVGDTEGPTRARLMEVMTTQVARLEELVQDLLDLSRLESEAEVRAEAVTLAELAPGLRARFEAVCRERNLTLEFETAANLGPLRSDRRLLELILGNLIDNATKFAFEGTAVRIAATPLFSAAHQLTLGGAPPTPTAVRLEVADRGVGIPLDQQQRIFERFYQVDLSRSGPPARRGSGLGLAIVKHAVRRLGGTIRVQSVWQQGTTMIVEIPAAAG